MNNVFFITALDGAWIPVWAVVIAAVAAYFIGNINPAILFGKAKGIDIRAQGSGNAGATNAVRSLGKKVGAITFLIDVAKGWICCFIPTLIFQQIILRREDVLNAVLSSATPDADRLAALDAVSMVPVAIGLLCGLCAVLGHMYPAVFGFRGGKGVSTTLGALIAASPVYALAMLAVVIVFTLIFRRVSLSVLIAVVVALVLVFAGSAASAGGFYYQFGIFQFNGFLPLWMVIILALVVWKHRGNIVRLAKGQETKLSFGSGKESKK